MQEIPFSVDMDGRKINGFLNVVMGAGSSGDVPRYLHCMVRKADGYYYWGNLFMRQDRWVLLDSPLSGYTEYLGNIVELWYE